MNLDEDLLATARRRTIYAKTEAKLRGIDLADVRRAIQRLRRKGLIYASDQTKPNYFGNGQSGYRANP